MVSVWVSGSLDGVGQFMFFVLGPEAVFGVWSLELPYYVRAVRGSLLLSKMAIFLVS